MKRFILSSIFIIITAACTATIEPTKKTEKEPAKEPIRSEAYKIGKKHTVAYFEKAGSSVHVQTVLKEAVAALDYALPYIKKPHKHLGETDVPEAVDWYTGKIMKDQKLWRPVGDFVHGGLIKNSAIMKLLQTSSLMR